MMTRLLSKLSTGDDTELSGGATTVVVVTTAVVVVAAKPVGDSTDVGGWVDGVTASLGCGATTDVAGPSSSFGRATTGGAVPPLDGVVGVGWSVPEFDAGWLSTD